MLQVSLCWLGCSPRAKVLEPGRQVHLRDGAIWPVGMRLVPKFPERGASSSEQNLDGFSGILAIGKDRQVSKS